MNQTDSRITFSDLEQIYWAKDIIFVFVERESEGMHAWLSAYHRRPNDGEWEYIVG